MSGSTLVSPLQTYAADSANEAKYATAAAAANTQQAGLISYFQSHAAHITTQAALLKDYRALSVVLGAFGLSSLVQSTALVKQLITQDPTSTSSVAHRIANAKYLAFAKAMQSWNPPPFGTASGVAAIVTAYKTNNFETQAGQQSAGLRQALYFTRIAPSITSYTQLQSDPDLMAVAVTGLGLPLSAFDNLSFTQQSALLKQKLTIADLQKPSYVRHLAQLYLVQQQLASSTSLPKVQPGTLVSLFSPAGSSSNTGNGLLAILQNAQNASSGVTTSLLGSPSGTATNPLLSLFA